MALYKAIIKPIGSYASPLQSDTFFGAFCWSYKYLYGKEALDALLEKCRIEKPQIIFSNAFPSDYLPLPMGVYDKSRALYSEVEKSRAKEVYQNYKKMKKCSLIRKAAFRDIQKGNRSGYSEFLAEEQAVQQDMVHNMVNRESGIVNNDNDRGNLFVKSEFFTKEGETYDVYILTELNQSTLEEVLDLMLELGIGGRKSTGKGAFTICSLKEETELMEVEGAGGYIALSNFIPNNADPVNGWYKTFVKYGKMDREFAAGTRPFKKPLLYIRAGAVFKTNEFKPYFGTVLQNVSLIDGVVVNACTIALPIVIPD